MKLKIIGLLFLVFVLMTFFRKEATPISSISFSPQVKGKGPPPPSLKKEENRTKASKGSRPDLRTLRAQSLEFVKKSLGEDHNDLTPQKAKMLADFVEEEIGKMDNPQKRGNALFHQAALWALAGDQDRAKTVLEDYKNEKSALIEDHCGILALELFLESVPPVPNDYQDILRCLHSEEENKDEVWALAYQYYQNKCGNECITEIQNLAQEPQEPGEENGKGKE